MLCRKHISKACMIYVVSGMIQIISEEDSETPILSLSCGTCFGETTLLIDYPATYSVISTTYCETIVLESTRFVEMYKMFPKTCRNLALDVAKRYNKAKEYNALRKYQQSRYREVIDTEEDPSMVYIKSAVKEFVV
ncbi:cyclic nucleotide-binding domain [Holotrichia oblita]|uniref:Cyclic nucleotide-binding domain n=1 Tax=Holotrichia oblita TaxID=644536 RepID=A0ACB9TKD7_HOLOL|nr:cyclic nucleotide-binding domain [Holotrichia oblita]